MVPIDLALISAVPLSFVGPGSPAVGLALALGGIAVAATLGALPFALASRLRRAPVSRPKPASRPRLSLGSAEPPLAA